MLTFSMTQKCTACRQARHLFLSTLLYNFLYNRLIEFYDQSLEVRNVKFN